VRLHFVRPWWIPLAAIVVLLVVVGAATLSARWLAAPGPSPSLEPLVSGEPARSSPAATPAEQIGAGTLARVVAAAAVLDEPGGAQWGLLEPDHNVLVIDVREVDGHDWYRIEFEYCCAADAGSEWVFGWVAADLETAGLATPGFGIDPPEVLAGPTLEAATWACPRMPEDLYRIPEPVRHQCYDIGEIITIRGVIGGGDYGEALYPGDPAHLTALPNASLVPRGMETGYRLFPLHIPSGDPLLLAWLNDERVKNGEEIEVSGVFGPGAVVCTKAPRRAGFPPMTRDEQQLWCDQQFSVGGIHADGPDPILEAPLADPLWTPPPGVQPAFGAGWRLLASATMNQLAVTVASETVDYALDVGEYRRLWLSMASGEPPAVDFTTEFAIRFVPPVSSTCPWIAFTGIGTRIDERLLYGIYEHLPADLFMEAVPGNFGCTSDAAPHAFLVAVDRSLAPADEFRLRLQDERLCDECGITWDEVVVHLHE
jgi:hypothetical protein